MAMFAIIAGIRNLKEPAAVPTQYLVCSAVKKHCSFANRADKKARSLKTPNKTVKGTRRPNAVLKVCSFIGFGGFAKAHQASRPLP